MNRRGFLSNLIKGVAAFSILPPATTYERVWKATIDPRSIINPAWVNAEYEAHFLVFDGAFAEYNTFPLHIAKKLKEENDKILQQPTRIYRINKENKFKLVAC